MGLVCQLIFQPVIKIIQVVVSVVEYLLVQLCRLIQELVNVVTQVLEYVCTTVTRTVCNAVCSVVCGICDLFCGLFGCDCGCDNVCKSVCGVVTDVLCGWTYVATTVLQFVTRLVCSYVLQALIVLLNLIEAIVTMVLTWVCTLIDLLIRWFLCWIYVGDIFDNTKPREFRVSPKIVPNAAGYSDWYVYVQNPNPDGNMDQTTRGYVLSDEGKPLIPVVDRESQTLTYYEVATRGNVITGKLATAGGPDGAHIPGEPFLYYPYKVMEIASHLFGDIFATASGDDGFGTDFHANLLTYSPSVQALLAASGKIATNNYNKWSGKYTSTGSQNYFGDESNPDMGTRVDTDATCSHPTNTFLQLIHGTIGYAPGNTSIAEEMSCGAGQTLTFDQTNYLMVNKDSSASVVTTYFVSRYNPDEASVGCNDLLGYTVVTFDAGDQPIFIATRNLPFHADTNKMMAEIVENVSGTNESIVRVAETYLHECGHQCGLLHDTDPPDCEDDMTLRISKIMNPGGSVRRAYTRFQWCMIRGSWYVTSRTGKPFTRAPELPDSKSAPAPPVSEPGGV